MRPGWRGWRTALSCALLATGLALAGCATPGGSPGGPPPTAPETSAKRDANDQRIGAETHPQILARYGGAYTEGGYALYVEELGRRLADVSEQSDARWTFTVLDTPSVNAFAVPGGYVYVTRGLMALAEDEAQLAGVIGHEIGHVTAGHSELRRDRSQAASIGLLLGTIGLAAVGLDPGLAAQAASAAAGGVLADYSRADELAADQIGIRYMAEAGYDPQAQAEFLEVMGASQSLQARAAGQRYDPNRVDFFSSHPATAERTREAIAAAERTGTLATGRERGRERYLAAIDGMIYGDSPAQGFVSGRRFEHPVLRFAFEVPSGFTITNTTTAVLATGPRGARLLMDGDRDPGGSLESYLLRRWVPAVAKGTRISRPQTTSRTQINGLDAAEAVLLVEVNGRPFEAIMTVVRHGGALYRIMALAPQGTGQIEALATAAGSFRGLSTAEAEALQPKRIRVITVQPGDTAETLGALMALDGFGVETFRVINGLGPGEQPAPGSRVKLVQ